MAAGDPSNVVDELDGLGQNITEATLFAITRTPTVLTYDYDGVFPNKDLGQSFPLIMIRPFDWRIDRLHARGGQLGGKGQELANPSLYTISIEDAINPRATGTGKVAAAQRDCYLLAKAIVEWFDVVPNRCLPVLGTPTVTIAGEHIRFRVLTPYKSGDAGEVRVAVVGVISVVGIVHKGSPT